MGAMNRIQNFFLSLFASKTQSIAKDKKQNSRLRPPSIVGNYGRLWELTDIAATLAEVEAGSFLRLGMLSEGMKSDGLIKGLLNTRSAGMLALPVLFRGDPYFSARLGGKDASYDEVTGALLEEEVPREWDRILPNEQIVAMIEDAIVTGAAIGRLEDDLTPGGWRVLRHLDVHFLTYVRSTDEWFYQDALQGRMKVTPGDGRWVMLTPYGTDRPWIRGAWTALAPPFIAKHGTLVDRLRWQRFQADGLRSIVANENASEAHLADLQRFIDTGWAYSPGIALPKGYSADITESSGKGFEVYCDTEDRADKDISVALTGQMVTMEGGKGFSSGDIWRDIALSLTQAVARSVAAAINAQVLDPWTMSILGVARRVRCEWDLRDSSKKIEDATFEKSVIDNAKALSELATSVGEKINIKAYFKKKGLDIDFVDQTLAQPAMPAQGQPAMPGAPVVDEEPSEDVTSTLAAKMTEHGVDRCEHGSTNRCRLCGVERVRDFTPDPNGNHAWSIAWRPIPQMSTPV